MLTTKAIQDLLGNSSDEVLSLYLNVDPGYQPNQSDTSAWRIYAKNALRDAEKTAENSDQWQAIRRHVDQFFGSYTPNSKSLVLFVSADGILQQYELGLNIDSHHAYGAIDVVPLLWALDEHEQYLVVLVDLEQARFLSARLGYAVDNHEMRFDFADYDFGDKEYIHTNHSSSVNNSQGDGADQFEDMKAEHLRRFHNDIASRIRELIGDMGANRIVLGGNEQSAHQVRSLLHDRVEQQVVDILSIEIDANQAEIVNAIQDTALNYERSQELDLVNDVIDLAKSGGRGTLGRDAVREALTMQQVELLILPYPMDNEDLARELTLATLENGAQVELVHGSAAARLKQEGDFAARLYYAMPEA
ncbi:MAG: VLRF1 family aeRF1-type release factor [Anaerolineae bacterium]